MIRLAELHDFIRALYYLRRGATIGELRKLMTVSQKTVVGRVNGWIQAGIVEARREKRGDSEVTVYYLRSPCIWISGFGRIKVSNDTIIVEIDPRSKFLTNVRRGNVVVKTGDDC